MREKSMRRKILRALGLSLFLGLMMSIVSFGAAILPANVSAAGEGQVLLGVRLSYLAQQQAGLDRINEIRQEACREGVINPDTGSALTTDDYVPMQWSAGLEQIARLRSAECAITFAHLRPNGTYVYDLNGWTGHEASSECIAAAGSSSSTASSSSIVKMINLWYSEKSSWVNGGSKYAAGHYLAMISPSNISVGLGLAFVPGAGMQTNLAGEFSEEATENSAFLPAQNGVIQTVEVPQTSVRGWGIDYIPSSSKNPFRAGNGGQLFLVAAVGFSSSPNLISVSPVTWASSAPDIATVDAAGTLRLIKGGQTTISAYSAAGSASAGIKVEDKVVTKKKPTVSKPTAKKRKVTVRFKKLAKKQLKKLKVTGIEVQVSADKKFGTIYKDKILSVKKSKYTFKGEKKKTYYIRIRYVCQNGVGKWSKVYKVKTKK